VAVGGFKKLNREIAKMGAAGGVLSTLPRESGPQVLPCIVRPATRQQDWSTNLTNHTNGRGSADALKALFVRFVDK
jgi:hypothetical protein